MTTPPFDTSITHDQMAPLSDIHTLKDAIETGRFGWKAIQRLNEGIKKTAAQLVKPHCWVNVATLDNSGVLFNLCSNRTAPLQFLKTYDATEYEFYQLKSMVGVCDGCNLPMPAAELKTCTGCKIVVYCGKACQKAHWKQHKEVCRRMPKGKRVPGKRHQIKHPLKPTTS